MSRIKDISQSVQCVYLTSIHSDKKNHDYPVLCVAFKDDYKVNLILNEEKKYILSHMDGKEIEA